jgi:hypothetical protein
MENEIKNMSRITSDAREPRNRKKGNGYPLFLGRKGNGSLAGKFIISER